MTNDKFVSDCHSSKNNSKSSQNISSLNQCLKKPIKWRIKVLEESSKSHRQANNGSIILLDWVRHFYLFSSLQSSRAFSSLQILLHHDPSLSLPPFQLSLLLVTCGTLFISSFLPSFSTSFKTCLIKTNPAQFWLSFFNFRLSFQPRGNRSKKNLFWFSHMLRLFYTWRIFPSTFDKRNETMILIILY